MQTSILKPEEQKVVTQAAALNDMISRSAGWAARFLKDEHIRGFMEKVLHEKKATVRKISDSAHRPIALGVFGASQCGKSYLVSELVRGSRAILEVFLNPAQQPPTPRDYLEEVNPAGGRESTAVVTRFTSRPYREVAGCSAHIRLLNRVDLIKILLNGYLFECQSDFLPTADELQKLRYSFRGVPRVAPAEAFLTEDDVWDLQDYVRRHFRNQFLKLLEDINYWKILNEEIRFLPFDCQMTYLEWLWGKFSKLTEVFRTLLKSLGNLGGEVVGIHADALLPREQSIIDVQRLAQMMSVGNRKVSLVSSSGGVHQIDAAVLCALTCELILKVKTDEDPGLLADLDVLDFPGARARAQVFDNNRLGNDPLALVEVYLRGKVAYLFDRYSDDRDITGLVLCQESGPQEAKSLPYMINKWVEWSQGSTPQARQGKAPQLFHVFTKFDIDLIRKKGEDPRVRWESRLKTNFEEFFGRAGDWVEKWDERGGFRNCFWVRNPNVQQTVFGRDRDGKEFVRDEQQLAEIREQYLGNDFVRRHFADPQEAWSRAAMPGQAGIGFLVEQIRRVIDPAAKVRQLDANLKVIYAEVQTNLSPYYIGDDITKARSMAEERAKKRLAALGKEMAVRYSLPQILDRDVLSISDRATAMVFDGVINPMLDENEGESSAEPVAAAPVFAEDIFAVPGAEAPAASSPQAEKKERRAPQRKGDVFARAVLANWQEQLAFLAKDEALQQKTGLDGAWFSEITQEIIKGASRLKLEQKISEESDRVLNSPNAARFMRKTAARVSSLLNRYVLELGQPCPEPPVPTSAPKVTLSARAYPGLPIYQHWTGSLVQLFKDNVAEAGADDEAANQALREILVVTL
jgi:hypothetical protein